MAQYYEKYRGTERVSIVNALTELDENATYIQRERIAAANGITNYTGTSTQNLQMLSLLKDGKLIRPSDAGEATVSKTPTEQPKNNRRRWVAGGIALGVVALLSGFLSSQRQAPKAKVVAKLEKKRKNNRKKK